MHSIFAVLSADPEEVTWFETGGPEQVRTESNGGQDEGNCREGEESKKEGCKNEISPSVLKSYASAEKDRTTVSGTVSETASGTELHGTLRRIVQLLDGVASTNNPFTKLVMG